MGPGVRSTTTEPIAARASARAPKGMPTSWATPSETDAAATPAIIRSLDGTRAIELLYSRSPQRPQSLAVQANRGHGHPVVDPRHGTGDLGLPSLSRNKPVLRRPDHGLKRNPS